MAVAYFNGKVVELEQPVVPIDERGHQFGDGVYEVVRFYNKKPFMMNEHMERLFASADAIKLKIGMESKELQTVMLDLLEKNGLEDGDVYIQATRGVAPRNHLFPSCPASLSITAKPAKKMDVKVKEQGVKVKLLPDERWQNCYIKSLNLLPNILAKQEAFENGCFEAVLVRDGFITEGSSSNFFVVKNGEIWTTPLSNRILHGITRLAVKQIAEELKIPFVEKQVTPADLYEADEAFMTSTSAEITPVTAADNQLIGTGKPGPITAALFKRFKEIANA